MSKKIIAAALLTSLLGATACSHTVRHATPLPPLVDGQRVTATAPPSGEAHGQVAFRADEPDGPSLLASEPRPLDVTVTIVDRRRGARDGALIGLGTSAVLAGAWAAAALPNRCDDGDEWTCEFGHGLIVGMSPYLIGGGLLLGTLSGAIIGGVVGHRRHDVYAASALPQIGVAPTAGGAQASAAWRF